MTKKINSQKNSYDKFLNNLSFEFLIYPFIILVCFIFSRLSLNYGIAMQTKQAQEFSACIILFFIAIFISSALFYKDKFLNNEKLIITYIILLGFFIKLAYVLYTSIYDRQHDVSVIGQSGHLDYITHIFMNKSLPDSYDNQFYHPPLHHFISALWLNIQMYFRTSFENAIQTLRFLPIIYTTFTTIISYKILKLLNISKTNIILGVLIISVHPTMTILSASINNDTLCLFLTMLCFLQSFKWFNKPTLKNIILLAISLALSALTKLSALTIALPIGVFFLIKLFIREDKKLTTKTLWFQYTIFAIISIPLSLSHSIYNFIKFGQPFGYVPLLDVNGWLYNGDAGIINRFIKPFSSQLFNNVYTDVGTDFNIYEYILKCSLFGEANYYSMDVSARLLTIFNAILIVISLISMFFILINAKFWKIKYNSYKYNLDKSKSDNPFFMIFSFVYWLALVISYISFNIKYPFGCTMDFRYIVPTFIIGVIFICKLLDYSDSSNSKLTPVLKFFIYTIIIIFSLLSSYFYLALQT